MNPFARTVALQDAREVPPMPTNVMLELSARCPQSCPMCPLQGSDERMARDEGLMDGGLFRRIVDQLAERPPEVLRLHYSGESTVHPKLGELGRYARARLPKTWFQMNTGGLLWSTEERREDWLRIGIDKLTFSIEANRYLQDGVPRDGDPWTWDGRPTSAAVGRSGMRDAQSGYVVRPYRAGSPWDTTVPNVLATARTLARLKRTVAADDPARRVRLHVQHMFTREQRVFADEKGRQTTWEIEFSRAFWVRHGVEVQAVPVASIGGQVDVSGMVNPAASRTPLGRCREVWTNLLVSWDGRLAPCCVDHDFSLLASGPSLVTHSLAELWRSRWLTDLRDRHREGVGLPAECVRCLAAT